MRPTGVGPKMTKRSGEIFWGRVLLHGVIAAGVTNAVVSFTSGSYALLLGFAARGTPDPVKAAQFDRIFGDWGTLAAAVLLTFFSARAIGARDEDPSIWNGVLVGVLAAMFLMGFWLFFKPLSVFLAVTSVMMAGAGWTGGWMRRRVG